MHRARFINQTRGIRVLGAFTARRCQGPQQDLQYKLLLWSFNRMAIAPAFGRSIIIIFAGVRVQVWPL